MDTVSSKGCFSTYESIENKHYLPGLVTNKLKRWKMHNRLPNPASFSNLMKPLGFTKRSVLLVLKTS